MCDPITLAIVGASVGAVGSIRQGNAANSAAKANASMLDQKAGEVNKLTVQREELQRSQARGVIGQQLAAGAEAGGGLSGSNLDLLQQSMFNSEMDALNVRYQGLSESNSLTNEAKITRFKGKQARTAGYLSAASSILNGAGGYMSSGGSMSSLQSSFSQTRVGGSGFGTGLAYGNQDMGGYI